MTTSNFTSNSSSIGNSAADYLSPKHYYDSLSHDFASYHKDPVNVLLHLLTSPLGIVGVVSLIRQLTRSSSTAVGITGVYLLSLLPVVPQGIFAGTFVLSAIVIYAAREWKLTTVQSVALIVLSYFLQDLSHLATGEKTFQQTYSAGGQVWNSSAQ
jgi:uncharacterized membrane protein YGL010W